MTHHRVSHTLAGHLAFTTHDQARHLRDLVLIQVPDPLALCLMPDHVHRVHSRPVSAALGTALGAYARWRNHQLGRSGALWKRQPTPQLIAGRTKQNRQVRYVHLNPCRAGLVRDPLAWPWSTHRDRVGLAVPGIRSRDRDPAAFHAYVSSDPTVHPTGTRLPLGDDRASPSDVFAAVGALTRSPADAMFRRGPQRQLLLQSLRTLCDGPPEALAGVSRATFFRVATQRSPAGALVARVAGDPRFEALAEGDLRPTWGRYRSRR